MPLKGRTSNQAASEKARETFEKVAATREKDYGSLPSVTETVSFRVPKGEKARLRLLFARHGLKLSDAVKAAVYQYAKAIEKDATKE